MPDAGPRGSGPTLLGGECDEHPDPVLTARGTALQIRVRGSGHGGAFVCHHFL